MKQKKENKGFVLTFEVKDGKGSFHLDINDMNHSDVYMLLDDFQNSMLNGKLADK